MASDRTSVIECDVSNESRKNVLAMIWRNLSFNGRSSPFAKKKMILSHLNGYLGFGTLTALMGPSGSGKSTLLKCINGRNNSGISPETQIYVNRTEQIRSCFIVQDEKDHLMMGLTSKEALMYASKLKNNNDVGKDVENIDHRRNVERIMSDLMISDTAGTLIGRCSGGEMKRIAIAMELTAVVKPNLLCIDEPTSGLDSNAAEIVINCLKEISRKHNMAIVTSIHQPNADILLMYDQLYILSKGGICVYFNPPQNIRLHLDDCGIECIGWQIPVEVLIKVSAKGIDSPNVKKLANKTLKESKLLIDNLKESARLSYSGIESQNVKFSYKNLWHLMMRNLSYDYISKWKLMILQIIVTIGSVAFLSQLYDKNIGKVMGCINLSLNETGICKGIEEINKELIIMQNVIFHYFALMNYLFFETVATTLTFSSEVKVFINEHSNGWYSTSTYYLAKTIAELPMIIVTSFGFAYAAYYGSGQIDEMSRFYGFLSIYICIAMISYGLGYLIGIITVKNINSSLVLAIGIVTFYGILSDFFFPIKELPIVLKYISHISIIQHSYKSIIILIYGFDRCPNGEIPFAMYLHELEDSDLWYYTSVIIFYFINLKVLALLALVFSTKPSKRGKYDKSAAVTPKDQFEEFSILPSDGVSNRLSVDIEIENLNTDNERNDLAIAWVNLSVCVKSVFSRKRKCILNELMGQINLGSLTALMGPSGSGKSTLLKCINGRENSILTKDTRIYGNKNKTIKSCFIVQDVKEHLMMGLTGGESLIYASKIKNGKMNNDGTKINHKKIVRNLMTDLMILNTENTKIGECSGGEQKRLAVALELISVVKPDIMFIDEPTSGLDSNAAEVVIHCLMRIAHSQNIAIVLSIHQPNADVLMMFDQVYVLSKGGMCVYCNHPEGIRQFLIDCGIEVNEWQIPIEVLLKIASKGIHSDYVKKLVNRVLLNNSFIFDNCINNGRILNDGITFEVKNFSFEDFWYIFMRNVSNVRSQWTSIVVQYFVIVGLGLLYTYIYSNDIGKADGCVSIVPNLNSTCSSSLEEIHEQELVFQFLQYSFLSIMLFMFLLMTATIMAFTTEIQIFLNEHRNGWYSTGSYYWAKTFVELPVPLFITVSVACVYYYGSGQIIDKYRFIGTMIFFIFGGLSSQGHAFLFGIVFSRIPKFAPVLSVFYFFDVLFLCGFIAPLDNLPKIIEYLSNISYLKHVFQSILIITYGFDRCSNDEISTVFYRYNLEDYQIWINTIGIIFHVINFRILSLLALIIIANPNTERKH